MKKLFKKCFTLLFFTIILHAQDSKDKIKISGSIFNDFFYNINSVDSTQKDMNGFTVRRIFFTTDYSLSEDFDARLRFEGTSASSSLTTGGKLTVAVKDAFVKWKNIFNGSDFTFGLSPTPAYEMSEAWGYRSLEKSPVDLYNVVNFRDIGVDLRGKLTNDGKYIYWIKIGNNSANSPETNNYKRFYASLQMKPIDGIDIGFYGDYASAADKLDNYDSKTKPNNQFIWAVFLTHKNEEKYSIGVNMFAMNTQNNYSSSSTSALQNQNGLCYSFWGWSALSEKLRLVGRIDRYSTNIDLDQSTQTFCVVGLDYRPNKSVSIMPNVEWFDYQKNYMGKEGTDLIARITFAYQF